MNPATGLIIAFGLIALGGVGLAIFAVLHRQRESDVNECERKQFTHVSA